MTFSFNIRSRGFLVARLQKALGVAADGEYGSQTLHAVAALQTSVSAALRSPTGQAGPAEFQALNLPWPTDFERAMNLVCCFEGTSFGDCNPTDIDGAGLTMGIAGFTTRHGEVQNLLARYIADRPQCLKKIPGSLQRQLIELLSRRSSPAAWKKLFFYADGAVLQAWRDVFAEWGSCVIMQKLQLAMAEERFWRPAAAAAHAHGFTSLQALCFFLDVSVQNGGWKKTHLTLARRMIDWHSDNPSKALAVAARAVAACAREQWRNDVLARKMSIASGAGFVHGRQYNLSDFALL